MVGMAGWSFSSRSALYLGLLGIFVATSTATTQCYYPNGVVAGGVPCSTDGQATHCCSTNALCLTNGLCLSAVQPYVLSRGGCTDGTWTNCTSICTKAEPGSGSAVIWFEGHGDSATYCCDTVLVNQTSKEKTCSDVDHQYQKPFQIPDGTVIPGVAALANYEEVSNSTNGTATSGNNSKDVAIGAGVGVPLGVIGIVSIAWALWERRKRKQIMLQTPPQPMFAGGETGMHYNPEVRNLRVSELTGSTPHPVELSESSHRSIF